MCEYCEKRKSFYGRSYTSYFNASLTGRIFSVMAVNEEEGMEIVFDFCPKCGSKLEGNQSQKEAYAAIDELANDTIMKLLGRE